MGRGSETAQRLTFSLKPSAPKEAREHALREIASAMRQHSGDVKQTAEYLGVGRSTLNRWIAEHVYLRKSLEVARRGAS